MHKSLIYITAFATLLLGGCSGNSNWSLGRGIASGLEKLPVLYKPTIQQGNIVSQDAMNELRPGMTKRQVRFVLGTPMLIDVFHDDRWDYVYTIGVGSTPEDVQRVYLVFENDALVRIEGDMRPLPADERPASTQEVVVNVPDWDGSDATLFGRTLRAIGLRD